MSPRPAGDGTESDSSLLSRIVGKPTSPSSGAGTVYLPGCGQVVRTLPNWKAPEGVLHKGSARLVVQHINTV